MDVAAVGNFVVVVDFFFLFFNGMLPDSSDGSFGSNRGPGMILAVGLFRGRANGAVDGSSSLTGRP